MDAPDYRETYLLAAEGPCCIIHACAAGAAPAAVPPGGAADALTYVDETFDPAPGDTAGAWVHGGDAAWRVSAEESRSGTTSFRSGDLAGARGASADASLRVTSSRGARLSVWYLADVGRPFDYFEVRVDGVASHVEAAPGGEWKRLEVGVAPGPHEVSFHVRSPEAPVSFDRSVSVEGFGTGAVYVDDLQFTPFS